MNNFTLNTGLTPELDPRLRNDCYLMGEFQNCALLLHKNALFPWFILVPNSNETELYKLPPAQQQQLQEFINSISYFVKKHFNVDKLNIASIGNIVSQLHIHIIGRHKNDACWPDVVWGYSHSKTYADNVVKSLQNDLLVSLGTTFSAHKL